MSAVTTALEAAVDLEGRSEYYERLRTEFVPTTVAPPSYPAGSIGAQRHELKPKVYEQVQVCAKLARELVAAHAELVVLLRAWKRLG
jgi:hypothetical protein